MKVTAIPIVVSALVTVSKGLKKRLQELEINGRIETIQTTAVLKSAEIFGKSPGSLLKLDNKGAHKYVSQDKKIVDYTQSFTHEQ